MPTWVILIVEARPAFAVSVGEERTQAGANLPSTKAGNTQNEKLNPFPAKPVSKCEDDLIKA